MSASIVSGLDAPPVFEAGEEVLDLVALSIELGVVTFLDTMLGMWGIQGATPRSSRPDGMLQSCRRGQRAGGGRVAGPEPC